MQSVLQNDTSNSDNSLTVYNKHCGFFFWLICSSPSLIKIQNTKQYRIVLTWAKIVCTQNNIEVHSEIMR